LDASIPQPSVEALQQQGSRRWRWVVAVGIVVIVAIITASVAFMLSGASGASKSLTAGNAPSNTIAFVDLRTDLPGDQHQKLADFMSHFPGFADRAQFDNAFDEFLNRITSQISPDLTYTSAFKAWTTGEISIAVTDLGPVPATSTQATEIYNLNVGDLNPLTSLAPVAEPSTSAKGALIVALKDRAAGEAWVSSEASKAGYTFKTSPYAGTTLYESTSGTEPVAYAFTDKVLIAGSTDAVKAGLDAPQKGSLASNSNYQTAMKSLHGDSVARFYVDGKALLDWAIQALGSQASSYGLSGVNFNASASWLAGSVRAESNDVVVEMTAPGSSAKPANRQSDLASQLPGSTVAVVESHSLGSGLATTFEAMAKTGPTADRDTAQQVLDALDTIGGIDWLGDTDVVVTKDGSDFGGGLVVKTPDASTASSKKVMLTNLLSLAGSGLSAYDLAMSSSEETYKGTTITLYSFTSTGASALPTAVKIGIATKGDLLIAGYEDGFIKQVLDTAPDTSLAAQGDYKKVMAVAGTSNTGFAYVDVAALVDEIGVALYPTDPAYYNLNYKPYVEHVEGIAYSMVDGKTVVLRIVVTVK
jgi:hypothetical protein